MNDGVDLGQDAGDVARGTQEDVPIDMRDLMGKRVGNFVISHMLGQGGMGAVFVAEHPALGRQVAVKFLSRWLAAMPEMATRFLDEARAAAGLQHPNVVEILDFGELDDRPYYVMELLKGADLTSIMQRRQRFTAPEVGAYLSQIGGALAAAHRRGIIHRDLKPANVFVRDGQPLQLKLLDFGIAKVMDARSQTRSGQVMGTPSHMAPEQALGAVRDICAQTDLYSLGAILYEMLTGRPMYTHESPMVVMMMHIRDPFPPIRTVAPDVPEEVARIVESCLAKSPAQRPESALKLMATYAEALLSSAAASPLPTTLAGASPHNDAEPSRAAVLAPRPSRRPRAARHGKPSHARDATVEFVQPREPALGAVSNPEARAAAVAPAAQREKQDLEARPAKPAEPERESLAAKLAEPERATPMAQVVHAAQLAQRQRARAKEQAQQELAAQQAQAAPAALPAQPVVVAQADRADMHEVTAVEIDPRADGVFSPADSSTLDRLLVRMQGQGDFPAFMKNVTEISRKARLTSDVSAAQLGDAILRDYALTAKLLRVVNSIHYERLGKRVSTVSRAVVLLGFEKVRSIALTIALHNQNSNENVQELAELSVQALISGEVARTLAPQLGLRDTEEAQVCAMFRNVGQQLLIHYLPRDYEKIQKLVRTRSISVDAAATQVIGVSLRKFGIGVARKWRLSDQLISSMLPACVKTKPTDHAQRLAVLSAFSGELCELVATTPPAELSQALDGLVHTYAIALPIPASGLPSLLGSVQKSFSERYATLLNLDPSESAFCRRASVISGTAPDGTLEPVDSASQGAGKAAPADVPQLDKQLDEIEASMQAHHHASGVLRWVLEAFTRAFGFRRAMVLVPAQKDLLRPLVVWGEDAKLLEEELIIPLGNARATDPFAVAFHSGNDVVILDAFSAASVKATPRIYYERFGSTACALYACEGKLLFADTDHPKTLPSSEHAAQLARVRDIVNRCPGTATQASRGAAVPRRR